MPLYQRFHSYHRHKRYSRVTACHSRVGLSGIQLDLGLQQPETPGQHGFPLKACGNDEGGSEVWGGVIVKHLLNKKPAHLLMPVSLN